MDQCSETNLLNSELIIFKLDDNLYCYSLEEIELRLNESPAYVNQIKRFENTMFENKALITSQLASKQKHPGVRVYRFPNFSINFTLLDNIKKGFNTFELKSADKDALDSYAQAIEENKGLDEEEKAIQISLLSTLIFKSWNEGEYNVKTRLYSVVPINRQSLLFKNNSDTTSSTRAIIEQKEIIESIPMTINDGFVVSREGKEAEFLAQNPLAGLCTNREDTDFITGNNIAYDDELIILYYEEVKQDKSVFNRIFCYTLNELHSALSSEITRIGSLEHNKASYFMYKGNHYIKLSPTPYFIVDALILERLLNENFNTLKLVPKEIDGLKYYQPEISDRRVLLPKNRELRSVFNSKNYSSSRETLVGRKDGFVYITKIIKHFDYREEVPTLRIDEMKIRKYREGDSNDPGILNDFNGVPAERFYYNTEANTIKEERRYKDGVLFSENDKPVKVKYFENGHKQQESWFLNDNYHRLGDKPARIELYENGKIKSEEWWINGRQHRDNDNPAWIEYYENEKIKSEKWMINDNYHRDNDNPAWIKYYENGNKKAERWWINDRPRRYNGPAYISYNKNGDVISKKGWFINGVFHNISYKVEYYPGTSIKQEEYWLNRDEVKHREYNDEPAWIKYNENGVMFVQFWMRNGKLYRENDRPTTVGFYETGVKESESWGDSHDGKIRRENDLPTDIQYDENGRIRRKQWKVGQDYVRDNGEPALIIYHSNETPKRKEWYLNERLGRANGLPVVEVFDENGQTIMSWLNEYDYMDSDYFNEHGMQLY